MNRRNLQNKELDRIGRKLLDAAKARREEIEQIADSPMLFDSIKARIEIERRSRNLKSASGSWANLQIWNWQNASAMVLFLLIAGVISLVVLGKFVQRQQIEKAAAPDTKSQFEQIKTQPLQMPPQIPEESPVFVKTKNPEIKSQKITEQKVFIKNATKLQKPAVRKPNQQQKLQPKQIESGGEFYALAFTGNPVETGEELQIVRAELSRSSLFALGVNLPIENETEKIKTDLLVGTDGVARAIRLVNKTENQ